LNFDPPALFLAEVVACELALELLNATSSVNKLLLTGEEGMALIADIHVNGGLGALCGELVATGAAHLTINVLGMDGVLHDLPRCGQIESY
jgi:hypothetical protein